MVMPDVVKSLRSLMLSAVLGTLAYATVGCGGPAPAKGPRDVLTQYAVALDEGRVEDAYGLLSDEAKKTLPFDAFQRMVKENPDEVKQVSRSLLRPSGPPRVTATVSSPRAGSTLASCARASSPVCTASKPWSATRPMAAGSSASRLRRLMSRVTGAFLVGWPTAAV